MSHGMWGYGEAGVEDCQHASVLIGWMVKSLFEIEILGDGE